MSIKSVAVIFDNTKRPETTGGYCLRALKEFVAADHFLPTQLHELSKAHYDLYLRIDDGLRYEVDPKLRPLAFWAIDTHLAFARCLEISTAADFVFAAQSDGAERLRSAGISRVEWLPLACDPAVHRPHKCDKIYDFSFVGAVTVGMRAHLLRRLQERFRQSFVGQRYFDEMARVYSASRLVFNRSIRNDVNMRVFEALACGSMLLTNDLAENGLESLFQNRKHLATYVDPEELFDLADYYLRHETEREEIAAAGLAEVLEKHTYRQRMQHVLESIAGGGKSTVAVAADIAPVVPFSFHDDLYYGYTRPEILQEIPTTARCILDIGCGSGALGAAIKRRQAANVTGIEMDVQAAALARQALDQVLIGDVESLELDFLDGSFDVIVCADVLEHMRSPDRVLKRIRQWLTPNGVLIASLPNVQNRAVITQLLKGNWTYEPAGLLDKTHIRFFTRRELEKIIWRSGLNIVNVRVVQDAGHREWVESGCPHTLTLGPAKLEAASPADVEDFFAYQFVLTISARPKWQRPGGRIPTLNGPVSGPMGARLDALGIGIPWPQECPAKADGKAQMETLSPELEKLIADTVSDQTSLVAHIGAGSGIVTAQIASRLSTGAVLAIDGWDATASTAVADKPEESSVLLDAFRRSCWDHRNRVALLRLSAADALLAIERQALQPEVVFFGRRKENQSLGEELVLAHRSFPQAELIGDGFLEPGVHGVVRNYARSLSAHVLLDVTTRSTWRILHRTRAEHPSNGRLDFPLTTIIMVTHNQLSLTRDCLASIAHRTDEPIEMIVVDNGSTDGTRQYLERQPGIRLIANPENRGFPAAVNQGMQIARGAQILLLNNDTVVTTGWLHRLLEALYSDDSIGMVGPSSNYTAGSQIISIPYRDLGELDGFAWEWGKSHDRVLEETERLVGFCLLIRRSVVEKVGLLDEQFGLGMCDDDDYSLRVIQAGFRCAIVRGAFVHHVGSQTFQGSEIDMERLLEENLRKFLIKWPHMKSKFIGKLGMPRPEPTLPPLPPMRARIAPKGGLLLAHRERHISATMIVRNNDRTIDSAMSSLYPFVDQICVKDTGSTDRTCEIVERYAVRLGHFPWCKDFAAARNSSLEGADCPWIFWMDSDDTLPQVMGPAMRALVAGVDDPKLFGFYMQIRCLHPEDGELAITGADQVHLFRNRPDYRWVRRIHEQILMPIKMAGGRVEQTGLFIVHSGSDRSREGLRAKYARDLEILHEELKERPDDSFTLFNFAMTYNDGHEHEKAVELFRRCLAVSSPSETHVAKTYSLLISSLSQLDRHEDAWTACQEGLKLFPSERELLLWAGELHHRAGRLNLAVQAYLAAIHVRSPGYVLSFNSEIDSHKAYQNLAVVYEEMGNLAQAKECWRQVVEKSPTHRAGWRGWISILLKLRQFGAVELASERLLQDPLLDHPRHRCEGMIAKAKLFRQRGALEAMMGTFEEALKRFPNDLELARQFAQTAFELKDVPNATRGFRHILELVPTDPAAHFYLAMLAFQGKDFEAACRGFETAVSLNPKHFGASLWLGHALKEAARIPEAKKAYEAAYQLSPLDAAVIEALEQIRLPDFSSTAGPA